MACRGVRDAPWQPNLLRESQSGLRAFVPVLTLGTNGP